MLSDFCTLFLGLKPKLKAAEDIKNGSLMYNPDYK